MISFKKKQKGLISKYNNFRIDTVQKISYETNNFENKQFPEFNKQIEIIIKENGDYHFVSNNSASKNIKLVIKENVEAKIYFFNKENGSLTFENLEIKLEEGSNLYCLSIDEFKTANVMRSAFLKKGAQLDFHVVGLNNDKNENIIEINLEEEHAIANVKVISIAQKNTYSSYNVIVNNNAPFTKGDIWQKAVVKTGGQNKFDATGYIKEACEKAENFQESRVLLLDDASRGDASPLLLINHHDVLAGHAASVSRVNEEELFYLQTRGITKEEAEKLMTIAFIKPLIDEIPSEEIQGKIFAQVNELLN